MSSERLLCPELKIRISDKTVWVRKQQVDAQWQQITVTDKQWQVLVMFADPKNTTGIVTKTDIANIFADSDTFSLSMIGLGNAIQQIVGRRCIRPTIEGDSLMAQLFQS